MPVCCRCKGSGRCKGCSCRKAGRGCTNCLRLRKGQCSNQGSPTQDVASEGQTATAIMQTESERAAQRETETEREAESGRETEPERVGRGETKTERETESVSDTERVTERVTPIDTLAGLSSTHSPTEPNHGPATANVPHVLGLPA